MTNRIIKLGMAVVLLILLTIPSTPIMTVRATTVVVGPNIDVASLPGTQAEVSIAVNPSNPLQLVAASNDVTPATTDFSTARIRAYFSSDGGLTWGSSLVPLLVPTPSSNNVSNTKCPRTCPTGNFNQQHDPSVAWDTLGNAYIAYAAFQDIPSETVVARSVDGGLTWSNSVAFLSTGFNFLVDKPVITVDTNPASPFFDNVYVAWDNTGFFNPVMNLVLSRSADHGVTFSAPVSPAGHTKSAKVSEPFEADPFVGPDGTVYVAWEDVAKGQLAISSSTDGGLTFGSAVTIASITGTAVSGPFAGVVIPPVTLNGSVTFNGALIYPVCGADSSSGVHRGTLYCSWMDDIGSNVTDIFVAHSTDNGQTWSQRVRVNDDPAGAANDHWAQWLTVDPTNGTVSLSWYDTRNDPTHFSTDVFYASSIDGGITFSANVQVTTASTNAQVTDASCGGEGQEDYQGITAYGGVVHLAWTDIRASITSDCQDIFTATITIT